MRIHSCVALLFLASLAISSPSAAQVRSSAKSPTKPLTQPPVTKSKDSAPAVTWDPKRQGEFVVSLCRDLLGRIWVGTEDRGVWCWDQQKAAEGGAIRSANPKSRVSSGWINYTRRSTGGPPDGDRSISIEATNAPWLGDDNAYALACDKLGRIWVGHLNHGVSIFNGELWRNYDVLAGPLGERVFAIKTCPVDGAVWIATSAGLTRYCLDDDTWAYYTRADGLPADSIQCLAFDRDGSLYVGTQCNGLAACTPTRVRDADLQYKTWRVIEARTALRGQAPLAPRGDGLPTNLINDILIAGDGAIYVATTTGVVVSRDKGRTWNYLRGKDWEAKAKGLYPRPAKQRIAAAARLVGGRALLSEDYINSLSEDDDGNVWIGHRQKGCEVLDCRSGEFLGCAGGPAGGKPSNRDYAMRLLPYRGGALVGTYGAGLVFLPNPVATAIPATKHSPAEGRAEPKSIAGLPSAAFPPTEAELSDMMERAPKPWDAPRKKETLVVSLDDDWRTQGDWIGRYGQYAAVLCAMGGGGNDLVAGRSSSVVEYQGWIGGNHPDPKDQLRRWVHWISSNDHRVLQCLSLGGRKQAEWDDHGETMPMTLDGPNMYATLKVPPGRYVLSLYFFNKDGHDGANRMRDFVVTAKVTPMRRTTFSSLGKPEIDGDGVANAASAEAVSRVHDFWGGVYKRFYIDTGKVPYITVNVGRNYSFCTILSGIFLDKLADVGEESSTLVSDRQLAWPATFADVDTGTRRAVRLQYRLLELRDRQPEWYSVHARTYLIRLARRQVDLRDGQPRASRQVAMVRDEIRPNVAAMLNDLCLFDLRDLVSYPRDSYDSFAWSERSQLATRETEWQWDWSRYRAFVCERSYKQTW